MVIGAGVVEAVATVFNACAEYCWTLLAKSNCNNDGLEGATVGGTTTDPKIGATVPEPGVTIPGGSIGSTAGTIKSSGLMTGSGVIGINGVTIGGTITGAGVTGTGITTGGTTRPVVTTEGEMTGATVANKAF